MRIIDADDVVKFYKSFDFGEYDVHFSISDIVKNMSNIPTIDPVIRCKDCDWYGIDVLKMDGTVDMRYKPTRCFYHHCDMPEDGYCSCAMRARREE